MGALPSCPLHVGFVFSLPAGGLSWKRQHRSSIKVAGGAQPPPPPPPQHARLRRQQQSGCSQQQAGLESLCTLVQQQPPADDGLLQQLLAPSSREDYLQALRRVGPSSYLSHLHRPVLPVDLRPWLQHELQQEEKKLAALTQQLQQQMQRLQLCNGSSSNNNGSMALMRQQLQHLRDERFTRLQQIEYLKERLHALNVLLLERQPPPLLLQLLHSAAANAKLPPHAGTGPAAAALEAAVAARGGATAAADPIAATLAATDAADFPVTVPPAVVRVQEHHQLQRFGLEPEWLLGKGLGALGRPAGLGASRTELEGFVAAGWAEDFPALQQLPGEAAGEAAARRLKAAAVRFFGGYDAQESPLEFKQRMQQLFEQQKQQQQAELQDEQQAQQQPRRPHPLPDGSPAAVAAAALQLQQEAQSAHLPSSALQLLTRYAHQRPAELHLKGTPAENAEVRLLLLMLLPLPLLLLLPLVLFILLFLLLLLQVCNP